MLSVRRLLCRVIVLINLGAALPVQSAEPPLVVLVASGRQFSGTMDNTSTADHLVLRSGSDGVTLLRPIRWERVERVVAKGKNLEVAALRQRVIQVRKEGTGNRETGVTTPGSLLNRIELRGTAPAAPPKSDSLVAPKIVTQQLPLTAIAFYPYIANWDADVETDGLVVELAPLDRDGYIVATAGTLEVELFSPQRRPLDLAPRSGGDTLELVERWTRAVTAEDIGPNGVRLRLPFGAIHPELNPNWAASWYGLVHVRFSAPGYGVFEDSRDGVRIRPWAPNRDQLEMNTGQRFLPTENLGRRE